MEFTEEQQEHINKLIGQARQEGRQSARQEMDEKLVQLEELRAACAAQSEVLAMQAQQLPKSVRQIIDALPTEMSPIQQLEFAANLGERDMLSDSAERGTPKPPKDGESGGAEPEPINVRL